MIHELRDIIVDIARGYVGQKEIKGNNGFIEKKFEEAMKSIGFHYGQSWCAYFVELVWRHAFKTYYGSRLPQLHEVLDKSFSANAVQTYNRLSNAGFLRAKEPLPGDLIVWRKYSKGEPVLLAPKFYAGHIGIVTSIGKDGKILTIEGNTNAKGGREGNTIAEKSRGFAWNTNTGLRLIGFIKPFTTIL